jgi:hypothetical protein
MASCFGHKEFAPEGSPQHFGLPSRAVPSYGQRQFPNPACISEIPSPAQRESPINPRPSPERFVGVTESKCKTGLAPFTEASIILLRLLPDSILKLWIKAFEARPSFIPNLLHLPIIEFLLRSGICSEISKAVWLGASCLSRLSSKEVHGIREDIRNQRDYLAGL